MFKIVGMNRNLKLLTLLVFVFIGFSCTSTRDTTSTDTKAPFFDEQAHRGGRGLMPENTIASQKMAIDLNCTMEMDLQMTKDNQIVVSHDAFLNALFVLTPQGDTMTVKEGHSRLIHNMTYDSLAKYEIGLKPYYDFPRQKKVHATKPLLKVLIDSVEAYGERKGHVNHYNIELKSSPKNDGKTYPDLKTYVDSVMNIIVRKGIAPRTMIQSFDVRALNMVHQNYPYVQTSYLVGAVKNKTAADFIATLGFVPDIFSPHYSIVTKELVRQFHDRGVKVIPWTPNKLEEIQHLKDIGCDGAITDYPDLYRKVK